MRYCEVLLYNNIIDKEWSRTHRARIRNWAYISSSLIANISTSIRGPSVAILTASSPFAPSFTFCVNYYSPSTSPAHLDHFKLCLLAHLLLHYPDRPPFRFFDSTKWNTVGSPTLAKGRGWDNELWKKNRALKRPFFISAVYENWVGNRISQD